VWDCVYPDRLAVLLGNEGQGLPPDAVARGDVRLAIPMVGTAESLNVAVAAGVILYDVWRQRASAR
jgi:TrmH family RNA methyltransferase